MVKKNLIDLEKDKFDNEGRVRVALDATADQDVVVKNTDSEPVPVKIINTDTSIDLEVNIGESITIDTTTPLDVNITNTSVDVDITALDGDGDLGVKIQNTSDINVNVTNTSLNTNATIQNSNLDVNLTDLDINGRLPVSVDNTPDVNVTNSSLNTNATIQNASLDVNLTDLNVSSQLPVSVDNQPTVTVDDSTPIDINVTNASINTNATIQGTPTVTVSGDVSIDDASAIRVDVTNASIATNATIQNSYINVYDKLYDGSTWVNQLSDSDGKAIVLEKKYYSASDITALGSSTSVREWLNAYADGILEYKYVGSYDDQFEVEVYLTHPDLGDSNKCLKLIYDYSTQNSVKVVQSVYCSVVDWAFDNLITGVLTITLGTITSPDPNTTIGVGTDICTIAVSNSGQGSITIDLSGVNASLYTLNNVTDGITGSSLSYDPLKSYVLETASDFSGSSYSHSVTITATNNLYGNTSSENVDTSGTYVSGGSWSNLEYVTGAISYTNDTRRGLYSAVQPTNNKGWWPTYDATTTWHTQTDWSVSFWYQGVTNSKYVSPWFTTYASNATSAIAFFLISFGNGRIHLQVSTSNTSVYRYWNLSSMTNWTHILITGLTDSTTSGTILTSNLYVNGSLVTVAGNFAGGAQTISNGSPIYRCGIGGIAPAYLTTDTLWANYGGADTPKIDEVTTWRTAFTSQEVTELYNSGTPFDPVTHSASTYLERYVRCGDATNDGTSIYDELDNTFVLSGYNSNDYTTPY